MNQQQSSNTTKKDIILQLLQSGVLKQRNLNDKISHEEISRLINDIISSSEDNTGELCRSKRDMGKGIYYSVIFMYRAYRLVDKLGWKRGLQVVNRYLGIKRGQEQTLETAKELLGDIEDFIDDLKQILSTKTGKEQVIEEYSDTSLHLAAKQGNLNAVKYFVEKGGDISSQNEMGYTPLHLAAKQGNLDIVKYLVEKGARRSRRSIESKDLSQPINGTSKLPLWMSSIVNWVKGSIEAPALLTSREHNNHTVIAVPEINTAVVNNTLMLGILATSLFNKT